MTSHTAQPGILLEASLPSFIQRTLAPGAGEDVVEGFRPLIPDAYPDGIIPNDAIARGLIVHAPIMVSDGHNTAPGNHFDLVVDGEVVPGTTVVYADAAVKYVVLRLPADFGTKLDEGFHDIAYRDSPKPWGPARYSEATQVLIDLTPAGARRPPRIDFADTVQREGLSLASLLTMPDGKLLGAIPDYADFEKTDKIHVCLRLRGGQEISIRSIEPSSDGESTPVAFDREDLLKANANGTVEFYYYVEDKAGNRSKASFITPIKIFIIGAPEALGEPIVRRLNVEIITENDVKPSLIVDIPAMKPSAAEEDLLLLYAGKSLIRVVQITKVQVGNDPLVTLQVGYDEVWDRIVSDRGPVFEETFSYAHVRAGVPSWSANSICAFDLNVAGGRDPVPGTPESEALPFPILRGAAGSEDNVIGFEDIERDASVHIGAATVRALRLNGIQVGDVVRAHLNADTVGSPLNVENDDAAIVIRIPSDDLKSHAGYSDLSFSVERKLSVAPHVSVAKSPRQPVRIDSADGLPGGGKPLNGAVFVDALKLEIDSGVYGIHESVLVKGYTPIRVYGYTNIAIGDQVEFTYKAFDAFDGGKLIPGASGEIRHVVVAEDVVPKEDSSVPGAEKVTYFDLRLDSAIVYALAFGRFESTYRVTNGVGEAIAANRKVLVSARRPAP